LAGIDKLRRLPSTQLTTPGRGVLAFLRRHPVVSGILGATREPPRLGPRAMAAVGALFYASVVPVEGLGDAAGLPAAVDFFLVVALQGAWLLTVLGAIGSRRSLIALALGLVVPIAAIGVVSELPLPSPCSRTPRTSSS
jgi:hypothetical protein